MTPRSFPLRVRSSFVSHGRRSVRQRYVGLVTGSKRKNVARKFSSVQAAVDAIARGEVVIVVDAEDRENEGDFICAAEKATPAAVNFVMSGRGEFCVPVLPDICQRLDVWPLVGSNTTPLRTAFMTPLDHVSVRTGITAEERSLTVRAIVDPKSSPQDFVRPGHVHLLLAKEGGVLRRAGHTEATVDLVRMAGLTPAGVLCEILDEQGTGRVANSCWRSPNSTSSRSFRSSS